MFIGFTLRFYIVNKPYYYYNSLKTCRNIVVTPTFSSLRLSSSSSVLTPRSRADLMALQPPAYVAYVTGRKNALTALKLLIYVAIYTYYYRRVDRDV